MNLITALAFYQPAPWAQYMAHKATWRELYTPIGELEELQIELFADLIADVDIDPDMTAEHLWLMLGAVESVFNSNQKSKSWTADI